MQTPLFTQAPVWVVALNLAMLLNETADAVLQGVCTSESANAARKLGVNWLQRGDVL